MQNDSYVSQSKFRGVANRILTVIGLVLLVVLGARAQSQLTDPNMVQGRPRLDGASSGFVAAADLIMSVPAGISPVAAMQNEQRAKAASTGAGSPTAAIEKEESNRPKAKAGGIVSGSSVSDGKRSPQTATASSLVTKKVEQSRRP